MPSDPRFTGLETRQLAAPRPGGSRSLVGSMAASGIALASLMVALILATSWFLLRRTAGAGAEVMAESLTRVAASEVAPALASDSEVGVWRALTTLFQVGNLQYAAVTTRDGRIYSKMGDLPASPLIMTRVTGLERLRRGSLLELRAPVQDEAEQNLGQLHVGYVLPAANPVLRWSAVLLSLEGAVMMAGSILFSRMQARRVTAPLRELARAVRSMGDRGAPPELPVRSGDEWGQVARAFNEMGQRLQETWRQIERHNQELERSIADRTQELRRKNMALAFQNEQVLEMSRLKSDFMANMSHELRTPLHAILALSEMIRMR